MLSKKEKGIYITIMAFLWGFTILTITGLVSCKSENDFSEENDREFQRTSDVKFYVDGTIFQLEQVTFTDYGSPKYAVVKGRMVRLLNRGLYFEPLDKNSQRYFESFKQNR